MKLRCRAAWATWIGLACSACVDERPPSELTDAEWAQQIVEGLPNWASAMGRLSAAEVDAYALAAIQLKSIAASDARAGVEAALSADTGLSFGFTASHDSNVFVLVRVLFDVPETVQTSTNPVRSSYAAFAAYAEYTAGTGKYPLRWPVEVTSGGVTGVRGYQGSRGAGPDALTEYDALASAYGLRDLSGCEARCGDHDAEAACQCDAQCVDDGDCCVDYDWRCSTAPKRGLER